MNARNLRGPCAMPTRRTRPVGNIALPRTDGRTIAARRFAAVVRDIVSEIGSTDSLTAGERSLIVQAATLTLACEALSERIARGERVTHAEADSLIRFASESRRIVSTLRQIAAARTAEEREAERKSAWRDHMEAKYGTEDHDGGDDGES
jgi:hypothetical protein